MSDCIKCGLVFGQDAEMCAECAADEIDRLRAEVDGLKDDLRKEWLIGYEEAHGEGYIPVSVEQIDKAWAMATGNQPEGIWVMEELGIVECPKCGGRGDNGNHHYWCQNCHGHGWIREERRDE